MRALFFLLLPACGAGLAGRVVEKEGEEGLDTTPPVIEHAPIEDVVYFGDDVTITATVTEEESRLLLVTLWFKNETGGSSDWQQRAMLEGDEGAYSAVIPGSVHQSAGMNYYIEAVNTADLTATDPDEGADDPHRFRITTM